MFFALFNTGGTTEQMITSANPKCFLNSFKTLFKAFCNVFAGSRVSISLTATTLFPLRTPKEIVVFPMSTASSVLDLSFIGFLLVILSAAKDRRDPSSPSARVRQDDELLNLVRTLFGIADGCRPATADRKSTRLNSSHSQISYAVFCL